MMRNNNEMTAVEEEIKFTAKKPDEVTYLALKLPKKVTWSEDTVDNEHMMIATQVGAILATRKEKTHMRDRITMIERVKRLNRLNINSKILVF